MEQVRTAPVKVLHMGDVFLDCPFSAMTAEQSAARRREARGTFLRTVKYAQEQELDLVLISGNLLDNRYATLETLEMLRAAFSSAPAVRFVICPGSHDPLTPDSIYTLGRLPENVTVVRTEAPSRYDFPEVGFSVTAWAFCDKTYPKAPLADGKAEPLAGCVSLVAGCAAEGAEEGLAPVSINQIGEFGGDYTALSGGSLFDGFHRVAQTTYAYSGALENSCYEEPGFGGANLLTLYPSPTGGAARVECARVDLGCRRYAIEEFDITGIDNPNEVLNRITAVISERGYGKETALRVILTGKTPIGFAVPRTMTNESFGVYVFDLVDRTLPAFDDSRVARDMTVRGEVCRTLIPQMRGGDEEEAQNAARALRIALGALDGRDVTKL